MDIFFIVLHSTYLHLSTHIYYLSRDPYMSTKHIDLKTFTKLMKLFVTLSSNCLFHQAVNKILGTKFPPFSHKKALIVDAINPKQNT